MATVFRINENTVITARHAWLPYAPEKGGTELRNSPHIIFDHLEEDAASRIISDSNHTSPPYNGWNRVVRNVWEVTGEAPSIPLFGERDKNSNEDPNATPISNSDDWVALRISRPPSNTHPSAEKSYSRPFVAAPPGWQESPANVVAGPLVLIAHPLGTPKRLSSGGKLYDVGRSVFEHDLESYSGTSGAPILRPVRTPNGSKIWLVGLSLGGRGLVQDGNGLVPGSHTDNLALDVSRFAAQIISEVELSIGFNTQTGTDYSVLDNDEDVVATGNKAATIQSDGSGAVRITIKLPDEHPVDNNAKLITDGNHMPFLSVRTKGGVSRNPKRIKEALSPDRKKLTVILPWPEEGLKQRYRIVPNLWFRAPGTDVLLPKKYPFAIELTR